MNSFKLFQKNEVAPDALIAPGKINFLEEDDAEILKKYVCQIYGQKKIRMSMMLGYICFVKNINRKKTRSD